MGLFLPGGNRRIAGRQVFTTRLSLSVCLLVYLFVFQGCLSACLSVCLSFCMFVCLSFRTNKNMMDKNSDLTESAAYEKRTPSTLRDVSSIDYAAKASYYLFDHSGCNDGFNFN